MTRDEIRRFVADQTKAGEDSMEIARQLQDRGVEKRTAFEIVESVSNEMLQAPEVTGANAWWLPAVLGGVSAAVVGGIAWTFVVIATERELGLVAWGIGGLCGLVVTLLAKARQGLATQLIAVGCSLLGIIIGKYGTFFHLLKKAVAEQYGEEAARNLSWHSSDTLAAFAARIQDMVGSHDIMWIVLAVVTAWSIPKRAGLIGPKTDNQENSPDYPSPDRDFRD